jgi:hypothetical protein
MVELRRLSREYHENPVEAVTCVVVKDKDEARHWIELKHTGENDGAGIVPWGSDEAARFRSRAGSISIEQQALNFLQNRGDLSAEVRRKVPVTSFARMLSTPEVRTALGVEAKQSKLSMLGEEPRVVAALMHVLDDLASGRVKVQEIYTKPQRLDYIAKLPPEIAVPLVHEAGQGVDISSGNAQAQQARRSGRRPSRPRDRLIPQECVLGIGEPRLADIERELRTLSLESNPNAVSVLIEFSWS